MVFVDFVTKFVEPAKFGTSGYVKMSGQCECHLYIVQSNIYIVDITINQLIRLIGGVARNSGEICEKMLDLGSKIDVFSISFSSENMPKIGIKFSRFCIEFYHYSIEETGHSSPERTDGIPRTEMVFSVQLLIKNPFKNLFECPQKTAFETASKPLSKLFHPYPKQLHKPLTGPFERGRKQLPNLLETT